MGGEQKRVNELEHPKSQPWVLEGKKMGQKRDKTGKKGILANFDYFETAPAATVSQFLG